MILARRSLLAAAALAPIAVRSARAALPGRVVRHADVAAEGLPPRHVDVWLPPEAVTGKGPFPLLLMHDGQNLFDPANAYGGQTWGVAEALGRLVGADTLPPTIVAGVWNTPLRWREYVPTGMLARLPAVLRSQIIAERGGGSLSDLYLAFLADRLLPFLRANHPVAPGPTTIMGSSMGGLISLAAVAERPQAFARAGCVSTHWPLSEPKPERAPEVSAALIGYLDERLGAPHGRRLWLDHGDQTLDANYAPYEQRVDTGLERLGWRADRDFRSRAYPGASHSEPSWRARIADPLTFLLGGGA